MELKGMGWGRGPLDLLLPSHNTPQIVSDTDISRCKAYSCMGWKEIVVMAKINPGFSAGVNPGHWKLSGGRLFPPNTFRIANCLERCQKKPLGFPVNPRGSIGVIGLKVVALYRSIGMKQTLILE